MSFIRRVEMSIPAKKKFIAEVKKREDLWNRRGFGDYDTSGRRKKCNALWDEVVVQFPGMNRDIAKKMWKNMVDQFRKILYAVLKEHPDATPDKIEQLFDTVSWPYFKPMLFLSPIIGKKRVENIVLPNVEETSSMSLDGEDTPFDPSMEMVIHSYSRKSEASSKTRGQITNAGSTEEIQLVGASTSQEYGGKAGATSSSSSNKDSYEKFGDYIVDLMRDVPDHLQRKCQQSIIQIINMYIEGSEPQMVSFSTQSLAVAAHSPAT